MPSGIRGFLLPLYNYLPIPKIIHPNSAAAGSLPINFFPADAVRLT
jgi:hypothetical protein